MRSGQLDDERGSLAREQRVRAPKHFRRPWMRSDQRVPRLMVRPVERFLRNEAGSASLLLAATVVALVWANLWPASYTDVWDTVVSVDLGPLLIQEDLQHWINDLLMAVFFYVVALEVKREMIFGSLRDPRSAAVPAAAAMGTIAGGALTYVAVNLIARATFVDGPFRWQPTLPSQSERSGWWDAAHPRSSGRSC